MEDTILTEDELDLFAAVVGLTMEEILELDEEQLDEIIGKLIHGIKKMVGGSKPSSAKLSAAGRRAVVRQAIGSALSKEMKSRQPAPSQGSMSHGQHRTPMSSRVADTSAAKGRVKLAAGKR